MALKISKEDAKAIVKQAVKDSKKMGLQTSKKSHK